MTEYVCAALRKAGILQINSPTAIRFCTTKCPYPDCIRATKTNKSSDGRVNWRKDAAVKLYSKGVSIATIAKRVNCSVQKVKSYIGIVS